VRESHTCEENLFQFEDFLIDIESKPVAAAFEGFNDDLNSFFIIFIMRLKPGGVAKGFFVVFFCS
jgi:hypothetical protein